MTRPGVLLVAVMLGMSMQVAADSQPPVSNDFAAGYALDGGEGSIRYLLLDAERYRGMASEEGGDIAVFNASGQQVPHVIEGQARRVDKSRTVSVPFFPVLGEETDTAVSFWQIDQGADSFELRYRAWREKREQSQEEAASYILRNDLRGDRLTGLTLTWTQARTSMIAAVRVEASNDMTNWSTLVSRAVVSRLSHDGGTLQQDRIDLKPTQAKYLRLSWIGDNPGVTIRTILADYSSATDGKAEQWVELGPVLPLQNETDSFRFDTGGPMPLRRLAFEIPADGLYYRGRLYSRSSPQQQWRYRAEISQYRLQLEGLTTHSSPITLPDVRDRFWKIELEQPLNLQPRDYPLIRVRLQPQRVVFLAQGEEPFLLAVGSRRVDKQSFRLPAHRLPEDFGSETAALARIGERVTLGGDEQLQPAKTPPDYKSWLLWAVLVLGVLVMGWMAKGLMKEMNGSDSGNKKGP